MIDTKTLRTSLASGLHNSQSIKDYCTANFGIDTFYVYSGVDIENTPNVFPFIGVRTPKASQVSDEVDVVLLIDLQILGKSTPVEAGSVITRTYFDEESNSNATVEEHTLVTYDGDDVLDGLKDIVVDEVIKISDGVSNLTLRKIHYEQDLLTTFPVYTGFIVFELYTSVNI